MKNILETIKKKYPTMSPKAQKLALYVLSNYKNVAVMNITTLATASGVSNATVVRFAMELGCSGYPQMQQELQQIMFNYYSSLDEIKEMSSPDTRSNYLNQVQDSLEALPCIFKQRDLMTIQKSSELINASKCVFLVGNRVSSPFVTYTQYLLSKYKIGIRDISRLSMEDEDAVKAAGANGCAIVFALQRYPNLTLKIIETLYKVGVPMIIFTDSELFPYEQYAKYIIYARTSHPLGFRPMMLIYSIIYEIILYVINNDIATAMENVKRFDNYVDEHNIYFKMSYDYASDILISGHSADEPQDG